MITIRGQNLVSRTDDDPLPHPCVCTKRPPCVDSKRHRVYRHHAHMLKHMCEWCRHTRGRFECTHGGRFVHTHTVFFTFFSACRNKNTHTPNTHSDHQQHHDHNDTHHTTPQHTTPHGDRDRERQRETETKKERQRKRDKTRQEQRRRDKKEKKREDERGETKKDKRR